MDNLKNNTEWKLKMYNEIICTKIQNQAKLNRPLGRDIYTVGKTKKKNKWKITTKFRIVVIMERVSMWLRRDT